ncbi:MAG TPA: ROK family protein, partial [Ilumatobacteraceae bacterium]|nr:ROK family protein [Ilumatobacteraceae bacterium]
KLAAGLMTMGGELIDLAREPVDHDLDATGIFQQLEGLVEQQLERARSHHEVRPVAVGVGCAGPIAPNCAAVSPLNIRAWHNFPLRDRLMQVSDLPVYGDLDAKALALAEGWVGAAQGRMN